MSSQNQLNISSIVNFPAPSENGSEIDVNILLRAIENQAKLNWNDVQKEMEKIKDKAILDKHPYEIWQATDGRWKTYLPDENKKNNRKMIARKLKEDIVQAILDFYKDEEERKILTIRKLYPEWLKSKALHSRESSYIKRIDSSWHKYYENDAIVDYDMTLMTKGQLDEWAHAKIKENEFSKKQFYNMAVIMKQVFQYAFDNELIAKNTYEKVKINTRLFVKVKKKEDDTQVFYEDEQKKIIEIAWEMFQKNPKSTSSLAIVLMFYTGCRVGEICALKFSDIEGNYLHVQRMETTDYVLNETGSKVKFNGRKVVEFTKSEAGDREIYLTEEAREIIERVKRANETYDLHDDDYIFVAYDNRKCRNTIQRVRAGTIGSKLIRYCKKAEISAKSTHKIRKTFISTLIDSSVNINTIRKMVGHEDERTTYSSYCFDRKRKNEIEGQLEEILHA